MEYPQGALVNVTIYPISPKKMWICNIHPLAVDDVLEKLSSSIDQTLTTIQDISDHVCSIRFFGPKYNKVIGSASGVSQNEILDELFAGKYAQLTVKDPRPNIPIKIVPVHKKNESDGNLPRSLDCNLNNLSLFDADSRMKANRSRVPDHLVSSRKNKNNKGEINLVDIPIVLSKSANFVDVLLPQQWMTAFWVAFVYNGARVGGLRELEDLPAEMNSISGNILFNPDLKISKVENERCEKEMLLSYSKKPPAKRASFQKMAIFRPFYNSWQDLVNFWSLKSTYWQGTFGGDFYLLRDFKILRQIDDDLSRCVHIDGEIVNDHHLSLVPVRVEACNGGTPEKFGLICLPSDEIDEEPVHFIEKEAKNDAAYTFSLNSLGIIGFTVSGGFSFITGRSQGIGFVSLLALNHLIRHCNSNRVHFRASDQRQYWSGRISIITNVKL